MHFILSAHYRPKVVELDQPIFDDKTLTTVSHFQF